MNRLALGCSLLMLIMQFAATVQAQIPTDIRELKLRDWEPRSMLVSKTTTVAEGQSSRSWTCTTT